MHWFKDIRRSKSNNRVDLNPSKLKYGGNLFVFTIFENSDFNHNIPDIIRNRTKTFNIIYNSPTLIEFQ